MTSGIITCEAQHADAAWLELCVEVVRPGCRNWLDLAARCYVMLCSAFTSESRLLSRYFMSPSEVIEPQESNPNFESLERLTMSVRNLACERWLDFGGSGESPLRSELFSLLYGLHIGKWGAFEENIRTPLWAVICGIDLAYSENPMVAAMRKRGPLNKVEIGKVGVYLKPPDVMSDRILSESGLYRIPESRLNEHLAAIQFYPKPKVDFALPKVVAVNAAPGRDSSSGRTYVKVGIAPFHSGDVIGFDEGGLASFKGVGGSGFSVQYSSDYASYYLEGVTRAVRQAIVHECDVLLFPELVMSPSLQHAVARELRRHPENNALSLVIAGSGWHGTDNICRLYDCDGLEIGTYHKRFPFEKIPRPESDSGSGYKAETVGLTEALEHPGATCTIVDIAGIGRVLPSICKDLVTEQDCATASLVRDFEPQLVCCAAMSASLQRGFDIPVTRTVRRGLAMTCVSNLCGFRKCHGEQETAIGIVSAPGFARNRKLGEVLSRDVREEKAAVMRANPCTASCEPAGSCLFIATIDYGANVRDAARALPEDDTINLPAPEEEIVPSITVVGPLSELSSPSA